MSLRAARPWLTNPRLTTPRPVPPVAARLRPVSLAGGALCRRWYARKPDDGNILLNNSAIIIPASVADTQPKDVLLHVKPVVRERWLTDTFVIILVTPAFAPWLGQDSAFLDKAVRKLYRFKMLNISRKDRAQLKVRVLCAVVDKLPAATAMKEEDVFHREPRRRTNNPPVADAGFEGVAYVTLAGDACVPSTAQSPSGPGAIDFTWSGRTAGPSYFADTLRLPLANTVFHTGTPTTMNLSTWLLPPKSNQLVMESKVDVSHHGVKVAGRHGMDRVITALSIPLVPLTFPRQVQGYMGNIIRELIGPGQMPITASSELERAVPQFSASRAEPAQAISAWALVIPESLRDDVNHKTRMLLTTDLTTTEKGTAEPRDLWKCLWKKNPPSWNDIVPEALAQGARLHRVLSGGGGWGKKAGLLSLDPVPITEEPSEDWTSASDGPGGLSSVLTPVVQDGDSIQFFISPTSTANPEASELEDLREFVKSSRSCVWSWEFGCIPSTMDSLPGGSWQHTTSSDEKKIVTFDNCFGALTEGGLTLTRRFREDKQDDMKVVGTTKVDVPFSRFSAIKVVKWEKYGGFALESTTRNLSSKVRQGENDSSNFYMPPYTSLLNLPPCNLHSRLKYTGVTSPKADDKDIVPLGSESLVNRQNDILTYPLLHSAKEPPPPIRKIAMPLPTTNPVELSKEPSTSPSTPPPLPPLIRKIAMPSPTPHLIDLPNPPPTSKLTPPFTPPPPEDAAPPPPEVRIRKLIPKAISISHIARAKLRRLSKLISDLTTQHRAILHEIHRRSRQHGVDAAASAKKRPIRLPDSRSEISSTRRGRRGRGKEMRQSVRRGITSRQATLRKPRLRRVRNLVVRRRLSRPRDRRHRRVLREEVVREVVDQRERPRTQVALRVFRGKLRQKRTKVLEDIVGGWLRGGGGV